MADTKHTPGEWHKHHDGHGGIYIGASERQVGYVSAGPDQEANASLVAAAPDLLAALLFYMSICGNTCYSVTREAAAEMYAAGAAAVAKATGSPDTKE